MPYTVEKGDSLIRIARANGTTLEELLKLNPEYQSNPNMISIGATIKLPSDLEQEEEAAAEEEAAPEDAGLEGDDVVAPEGAGGEAPGIMSGGTIHRVNNPDGQADYFIVAYEYPPGSGHSFYYQFDSLESLEQAIGPNMGGGAIPVGGTIDESALSTWTDGGNAAEVIGVQGTFQGFIDDIINDAAAAAGIQDPSLLGQALQDPEMQLILAQTAEGQWTPEQTKAAMRNTDFYKNVLYPGIENFYGQSTNPEAQYAVYQQNISAVVKSLGLAPDADGSYKSYIKQLADAGVTDSAFANFAPIYKQASVNVGYADQLSKWTEQFTGTAIGSFDDWFDVLAGNSPAEVQEIAQAAGLAYMAENAGFEITDQQIRNIADATDMSQEQAGALFSSTARNLLALGASGLRRGGLTTEDILNAEAGIGGNVEAIRLKMQKLAREEGMMDDPTATIFTDFNREGAPIKKGLQSSISEGA